MPLAHDLNLIAYPGLINY